MVEFDRDDAVDGRLESLLEFLELKDERRTGWVLRGVEGPESVAAHTWGTATLCLLYADHEAVDDAVDRSRAVEMALVHDLAEARTGDVPTRAEQGRERLSDAEKERAEREAMTALLVPFGLELEVEDAGGGVGGGGGGDDPASQSTGEDLLALWEEYERRETPTARFVKEMDLLENCLQALKYEREDRYEADGDNEHFDEYDDLDEFFATAAPRLETSFGERLFERIRSAYEREIGRDCQL
ncbi:putative hydrolases of HD superfamily [Halobiforma haloterrestris]|uniref:5'-deoxynucleotidase n=1 Tax=Natronobacterium haloterrestre TaxID=148448 RepID=A0A1I1KD64_NATHA|nr:HD domain-containing protein [Halobiforma haloterrestris]SFC58779.1 putative hydrolases of HD superfamily [Halobiforma haloterrestris]